MRLELYILAGANGSGKSTIARLLLPRKDLVFINPDEITFPNQFNAEPSSRAQAQKGE